MTKFVWLDLETTGLNESNCQILEVACIVTNDCFNILDKYETIVQPGDTSYEPGVVAMHQRSGLFQKIASGQGKGLATAESELLSVIKRHEPRRRRSYLAGNNVHFDKRFMAKYMPSIPHHLCSRHLDVSSVGLAMRARFGKENAEYKARRPHRAMDDLMRSLDEMQFYLDRFVRMPDELGVIRS
jgi:oligoribonuclease